MSDDKVQTLKVKRSSRLSGFYRRTPERRRTRLVERVAEEVRRKGASR